MEYWHMYPCDWLRDVGSLTQDDWNKLGSPGVRRSIQEAIMGVAWRLGITLPPACYQSETYAPQCYHSHVVRGIDIYYKKQKNKMTNGVIMALQSVDRRAGQDWVNYHANLSTEGWTEELQGTIPKETEKDQYGFYVDAKHRRFVPQSRVKPLLHAYHESMLYGGHMGDTKMYSLLNKFFT